MTQGFVEGILTRQLDGIVADLNKLDRGFKLDADMFDDGTLGEFEVRIMEVKATATVLLDNFQNILIERNGGRL